MRGNISKSKTLKGEDGPPGYTPKKGVDYLTDAEIQAFKDENLTPISESLDNHKSNGDVNAQHLTVAEKTAIADEIESLGEDIHGVVIYADQIKGDVNTLTDRVYVLEASSVTAIPNTLEPNKAYNFGAVDELVLAYPSIANDGDVIYVTFRSDGLQATNLIVSEINMHDEFDLIPEYGEGYELYAKYIDGGWLVKYSSYIPHVFSRVPEIEEE